MMPNMATTLQGFEESVQFQIVKKTVVDHELVETSKVDQVLWFQGVLQPIPSQKLIVKPEGERKFKWWTLSTDQELELDWVVKDQDSVSFRVMSKTDWRQAGYFQYELIEGPTS